MEKTKAAIKAYDAGQPEIDRLYAAATSPEAIAIAVAECARGIPWEGDWVRAEALEISLERGVQLAFVSDTSDINPGLHPSLVDVEFARRIAAKN